MHYLVHFIIVTSFSMIITFVCHCIMQYIPSRNSLLEHYFNAPIRSIYLYIRCACHHGIDDPACDFLIIEQDFYYFVILQSVLIFVCILNLAFGKKTKYFIFAIVLAWLTVERLGSYVSFMNLSCKIDVLTIYLFFWQLSSLGFKWIIFEVLPPICIIEQGSFCIMAAWLASIINFMVFQYLPRKFILTGFWLISIIDIYMCLHHRGRLYIPCSMNCSSVKENSPLMGNYFVEGVGKWKTSAALGLGDFVGFNIMVLLVIPQSSSIITKVCVTLGTIVCVQIGQFLTHWLGLIVNIDLAPGLPLPVIMVSVYMFLLDIIMPIFNQCIEL